MSLKRTLIDILPPAVTGALALPYDYWQTRQADRAFRSRDLPAVAADPDAPQHIVIVVVDALRGDAIDDETAPFLASLDGPTTAIAPGTWTFPSVSSMLTGQYPHEHGAMHGPDQGSDSGMVLPARMAESIRTLPEYLAGAGYTTYGGFGHDTPFVALSGRFGTHDLSHQVNSSADTVLASHRGWIESRSSSTTFSYLHLADPHIPVDPPDSYWREYDIDRDIPNLQTWDYRTDPSPDEEGVRYRTHRRRLYQASVAYVDDCLQAYVEALEAVLPEVAIVLTADHGETMWDQVAIDHEHFGGHSCVGHGGTPYEALTRVPLKTAGDLSIDWPAESVPLIDLAPTILESVGIDVPASMTGRAIGTDGTDRALLVEGNLSTRETKAVYRDSYKLIAADDGTQVGFEMPAEVPTDIPDDLAAAMEDELVWGGGSEGGTDVSNVVENRLEQLGYR